MPDRGRGREGNTGKKFLFFLFFFLSPTIASPCSNRVTWTRGPRVLHFGSGEQVRSQRLTQFLSNEEFYRLFLVCFSSVFSLLFISCESYLRCELLELLRGVIFILSEYCKVF